MSDVTLVERIVHAKGGYIVYARWPYGPNVIGCGPVVCKTLDEVIELLRNTDKGIDP
jgi:hypothetical protein